MTAMFSSRHGTFGIHAVISLYLLTFMGDVLSASQDGEWSVMVSASTVNSTTGVDCLSVTHCAILCMEDDNCGQAVFHTGEHSATCFNSPTKGLLHPGKCEPTDPALVGKFCTHTKLSLYNCLLALRHFHLA